MTVFNEKNESVANVLKMAFYFWRKSLLYQILYSILFISLLITSFFYLMDYYELSKGFFEISQNESIDQGKRFEEMQKFIATHPNAPSFSWAMIGVSCFLFPLNLGLFAIFRKIQLAEPVSLSNLFTGYRGRNFFALGSYFLFWILTFNIAMSTLILAPIWWLITLFVAPLMFFKNIRIIEGIGLTIKTLRKHFIDIMVVLVIGLIIKYIGIFSFFGIPLFFGFSNAIVFALYNNYFTTKD